MASPEILRYAPHRMDAPADDRHLLAACLEGRAGSWETFVSRFEPYLAEVCRRALRRAGRPAGPQEVRDAVQEAFLCLLERDRKVLRAYQGLSSLASYLAAVAAYRVLRGRAHGPEGLPPEGALPPSPGPGPAEAAEAREEAEHLRRAWKELPARDGLALALQSRGASLRELGLAMGISEDAAAQLVSRARVRLKGRLKPPGG